MTALLVALGAAVGAPLRYLVDRAIRARQNSTFPWATLTVNVAGSLLLGFIAALPADPELTALAATGFCGALTTYSTFSYETLLLARSGAHRLAAANVIANIAAGLTAVYVGLHLGG
ncbi:MAG TPA: fluoride efflux transporter CrcB [Micromonosporaceae bacterium]